MFPSEFDRLIDLLTKLPGISKKQALRIINFLLSQDKSKLVEDSQSFIKTIKIISNCEICNFYSSNKRCEICLSPDREKKLMIIENVDQIQKYETWKLWKGKYFIVPPIFNSKFERINNNFDFTFLLDYVDNFNEIVISISPTAEGVLTSNLIFDTIKKEKSKVNISKLAIGIPIGSSIDYIDQLTLSYAIKNRKDIK